MTNAARSLARHLTSLSTDSYVALFSTLATLGVLLAYHPWQQPALGDVALFQAFGRLIARGDVPYRDFFDQKTPFAEYTNASVALLAGWFHFDYVLGARVLTMALVSLTGGALYLLSRDTGLDRIPSLSAALLLSCVDFFAWLGVDGLEPKMLICVAGIAGLLAAYRGHWLASGVLCALAALAWQPGAVFLLGAGCRALLATRGRPVRPLVLLACGFLLPILAMLAYFTAVGALGDFWADTVTYNRTYVGQPPWPPEFKRAVDIITQHYSSDRWLFLVGAVGYGAWFLAALWAVITRRSSSVVWGSLPIAVVTLASVAYTAVHLGDVVDIIPFVPFVAFWTAWLLNSISRQSAAHSQELAFAGMLALLVYGQRTLVDQTGLQQGKPELGWQRDQLQMIERSALVGRGDDVYIVNTPWLSLLSDHRPLSRYAYLWNGVDTFVFGHEGGRVTITRPITEEHPKLVVVGFGAKEVLWDVISRGYQQIDPASLPDYRFPDPVEFWVRRDVVSAGSTAAVLPPIPVPISDNICQPGDVGPGYQPDVTPGWWLASALPIQFPGLMEQYRGDFFGSPGQPEVTCSASLFDSAHGGDNFVALGRTSLCSGCQYLPAPSLGADSLVVVGSGLAPDAHGYSAQILVSRGYLLLNVTVHLEGGSAHDQDALVRVVTAVAEATLHRFH